MKTLIVILIILSFLQAIVLSVNLVLIILISRSHIKNDKYNFYLVFGFGLLISHLSLTPLGLYSLVFLLLSLFTNMLSKTNLTVNSLSIMPIVFLSLLVNDLITGWIVRGPFTFNPQIFFEAFLSLPVFYLVRFWEERYIVRKEIKLRV